MCKVNLLQLFSLFLKWVRLDWIPNYANGRYLQTHALEAHDGFGFQTDPLGTSTFSVVWRRVASISTGQVPFFIFRWPLTMLFSGWTLLSVCQDGLSCEIDVKCLDNKLSCKNTWPLIHAWPPSPHQKYVATGLLNMQAPILKIQSSPKENYI